MITYDRALYLMQIERQCIIQSEKCDRQCQDCELVQNSGELLDAYAIVIEMLRHKVWDQRKK